MIAVVLYENLSSIHPGLTREHRFQREILNLWRRSWRNNGFETLVLTKKDFSNSDGFKNFCFKMEDINRKIYGNVFENMKKKFLWSYSISCWKRWFLFSELGLKEPFYCGDYDVINNYLTPDNCQISDKLTFLNGVCPCWASGTSDQFKNFCDVSVRLSEKNINKIIEVFKKDDIQTFYTDQSFCVINKQEEDFKKNFNAAPNRKFLNGYNADPESKLIHFSHNFTKRNSASKKYSDVARVKMIKEFLSKGR